MATYYVGLDVHLQHTTVCILDRCGKRVKRLTIRGKWSAIAEEMNRLKGKVQVCYEASTGYGYLHELLSRVADRVVVAHPATYAVADHSNCQLSVPLQTGITVL